MRGLIADAIDADSVGELASCLCLDMFKQLQRWLKEKKYPAVFQCTTKELKTFKAFTLKSVRARTQWYYSTLQKADPTTLAEKPGQTVDQYFNDCVAWFTALQRDASKFEEYKEQLGELSRELVRKYCGDFADPGKQAPTSTVRRGARGAGGGDGTHDDFECGTFCIMLLYHLMLMLTDRCSEARSPCHPQPSLTSPVTLTSQRKP
jgi:hypothetical protein